MEVLRKTDRHRTSTKFRLGIIMWVHEVFKWPSLIFILFCQKISLTISYRYKLQFEWIGFELRFIFCTLYCWKLASKFTVNHNYIYSFIYIYVCVCVCVCTESRDSSIGIPTGYWLDDRIIGVRFSGGAEAFPLSQRVQISSRVHPASYPMVTEGYFPGGKVAATWRHPLMSI
jgi:hypothetical protein